MMVEEFVGRPRVPNRPWGYEVYTLPHSTGQLQPGLRPPRAARNQSEGAAAASCKRVLPAAAAFLRAGLRPGLSHSPTPTRQKSQPASGSQPGGPSYGVWSKELRTGHWALRRSQIAGA
jgi:hypothetical protein